MVNTIYLLSFVETPRKFIIAELSIRKLGSSSVLIIIIKGWCQVKYRPSNLDLKHIKAFYVSQNVFVLLALMKIRAYGSKALQ